MRIILLIVCFAISETISARVERSYGGTPIPIEHAPYFVSIKEYGQHICGGSLITWKHVLTTASCIIDAYYNIHFDSIVVSGTDKRYEWATEHAITKLTVHPRFMTENRNPYYDITVLTLSGFVPMDSKHWPILFQSTPPAHLSVGSLIAFGNTRKEYGNIYLHKLPVSIYLPYQSMGIQAGDDPKYSYVFKGIIKVPQSSDLGDAGSPLIYNASIIGIASRMVTEDGRLFMNVYEYASFISDALWEG